MLSKIRHAKWFIPIVAILTVGLMVGGVFAVVFYNLNKTVPSTVTIVTSGGGPGGTPVYTLTVVASPTEGGTVTGGGTYTAGTYPITATVASAGYKFTGWTATVGATVTDVNSASTTVTVSGTATVTANFGAVVAATLYTDALATVPIPADYTHNFGVVAVGGTPQNPLWFRATEIDPTTITVTTTGLPGNAQVQFIVGTPMGSQSGKPCTIALWLPSNLALGTYNFSFVVTGHSP